MNIPIGEMLKKYARQEVEEALANLPPQAFETEEEKEGLYVAVINIAAPNRATLKMLQANPENIQPALVAVWLNEKADALHFILEALTRQAAIGMLDGDKKLSGVTSFTALPFLLALEVIVKVSRDVHEAMKGAVGVGIIDEDGNIKRDFDDKKDDDLDGLEVGDGLKA